MSRPICTVALGAMTNANKLPTAEHTSARVSALSVLCADNCLYNMSNVSMMERRFHQRDSDSCLPQRLY